MITLDALRAYLQDSIERIGQRFTAPDDDWLPMAFLEVRQQVVIVELFKLPHDAWHIALAGMARELGATTIATVMSSWMVENAMPGDPPPAEHPRRKEIVSLTLITATDVQVHMAPICRSRDIPPTLAAWVAQPADSFSGRMVDDLQEALRDD